MASSFVKVAFFFSFFLGDLASASPSVDYRLEKRALLIATNTLPGRWSSQGCYLDNSPSGRTLGGASYTNYTSMTEESCVMFCDTQGYNYAGVEYAQECYCGNFLTANVTEPVSDCQMACVGNTTEACGAGNRLNLFWSGKQPPPAPVTNPGPTGWTLLGCYTDSTAARTLTTGMDVAGGPAQMSIAACTYACKQAGFIYSGIEYASECYCGNAISNGGALAPGGISDCNMVCKGNSSEFCGAGNRLDLYEQTVNITSSSSVILPTSTSSSSSTKSSTSSSISTSTTSSSASVSTSKISSSTSTSASAPSSTTSSKTSSTTSAVSSSKSSTTSSASSSLSSSTKSSTISSTSSSLSSSTKSSTISSTSSSLSSSSKSSTISSTSSSLSSSSKSSTISSTTSSSASLTSASSLPVTTATVSCPASNGTVFVATSGSEYLIECYIDHNAGDLVMMYTNGLNACINLCDSTAGCVAFSYVGNPGSNPCYMKSSVGPPNANTGVWGGKFIAKGSAQSSSSIMTTSTSAGTGSSTVRSSSSTVSPTSAATGLPVGWKYDGCYIEGSSGRAIRNGQPDSQTNTVENCVNSCAGLGYTVAGMEFGVQCFCDNAIYNGGAKTVETDCNMACAGNANEMCGAGNRLSVYNIGNLTLYQPPSTQTTGLGSWTYQGCYSDNVNGNRALFWQTILTNNNSATNCLGLCHDYGYMSGGMEYGDECYCGDASVLVASGSTKQADTDCSQACSGDPNYICGNGNRLSYYVWTGTPLYVWATPSGNNAGQYQFFIGGVVVPLMTSLGINNKVTFLEKHGTGAPNTTGAYELDLTLANNFNAAWREMHVQTDIFCSGGLTLPDKGGRQLTVGGWSGGSTYGIRLYWPDGSDGVNGTHDWQENQAALTLKSGRWYPSTMLMTNGSILVMGGEVGSNGAPNPTLEVLPPPPGGYVKFLDFLDRTDPNNLYPFLFVLPSGGIFVGYWNEARILDPVTFDTIKVLPNIPGTVNNVLGGRTYPLEGTAVMLPQQYPYGLATMLICGGSTPYSAQPIDNCVTIQPDAPNPVWTIERMPSQRVMTCICALPDGTYLILNGATVGVAGFGLASHPNLGAVLYDPSKPVGSRMSIMANTIVARMYHSEAILLPDGGVLVSGSDPQDNVNPEEYRVEKFYPPYLLSGAAKPAFSITAKDWVFGGSYQITVTSGTVSKVSLMGAVSSTHGNSMGQKTIFPNFSCSGNTCTITAPPPGVTTPGWFQLFILNGPTPSMGQWVRIGGDPGHLGNWPAGIGFNLPGV